ncbi:ABC transporter permease [Thauera sinica]|uniref:ABC transporter permease n=1 Tax=Thauera sinica TaxID=2665146 RepID=A0ABW1AME8_9RHOO|nr:ABC transporter permease [Thauera sp. K11]ATE59174.1 ABC transporter permease [Thauera sp. K11]
MKAWLEPLLRSRFLQGAILPLACIALWELVSRQGKVQSYAFVPVREIFGSLLELLASGTLLLNLLATLQTAASGLLLGGLAGIAVGGLMGASRLADALIGPLFHALRQVPILGWLPLIGLWFGNGDFPRLLIVCLAAFHPLVLNTYEGVRSIEQRYLEVGAVLRFGRLQRLRYVLLPGALPSVLTGVMHGLAFSWIATVGSELLFATGPGLGGLMQTAQAASRMDVVVICVAGIGVVGYGMHLGFALLGRYLLRWRSVR